MDLEDSVHACLVTCVWDGHTMVVNGAGRDSMLHVRQEIGTEGPNPLCHFPKLDSAFYSFQNLSKQCHHFWHQNGRPELIADNRFSNHKIFLLFLGQMDIFPIHIFHNTPYPQRETPHCG